MMHLLVDTFSLGFSATALLFLRLLMTPFVIYNLVWSLPSCIDFLRGRNYPTCLYESVVFFMCVGLLGYNFLVFFGRVVSPWSYPFSLALECVLFLAVIVAMIGKRLALTNQFQEFYWLLVGGNLQAALRAAEMNKIDPDYTDAMLEAAEGTLAVRIAQKAMNRGSE